MTVTTILTLTFLILLISLMSFVYFRIRGIYKLNGVIMDLVIGYVEKNLDCTKLPKANELFTSVTKQLFSFKKLSLENWVSKENIEILKS